jgi:uncharacterized protein (DUF2235 family)
MRGRKFAQPRLRLYRSRFARAEVPMPKNIVVYSDGTGQDGGVRVEQRISNVYKMYRSSRVHPDNPINPAEQVCLYDPGLERIAVQAELPVLHVGLTSCCSQ